ncbi:MAG: hypothetical protein JNK34_01495 [Tabrizicola sp.]|nr:hypothetical protein [Tabrizicola sp.]
MADYFGIGRRIFYAMMERDEDIAARYKRGKAKAIGVIAQGLINKARGGDTASMIFFLKTQAGWRETRQIEHMLPEERTEVADEGLQKLMDYLEQIRSRKLAADAWGGQGDSGNAILALSPDSSAVNTSGKPLA